MNKWLKNAQQSVKRAVLSFFLSPKDLLSCYEDACEKAFDEGDYGKSEALALKLLEALGQCEKRGFRWNTAHTVLGRLALKSGDIEAAEQHLSLSIINVADHVTRSFGPSLDLARDLAAAGRSISVIGYLDKHAELAGVDHQRAFEIRYRAETGTPRKPFYDEKFDEALFDWQFQMLEGWKAADRVKQIQELIDALEQRIIIYGRPGTKIVDPSYSNRKVAMFRNQINKLKTLL